jgi:hypothetical protein
MSKKCPVCQLLRGKRLPWRKKICPDCAANGEVMSLWQEYEVLHMVRQTAWMYQYIFPVLLTFGILVQVWRGKCNFGFVLPQVVVVAMWVFNIFWFWPKNRCGLFEVKKRMPGVMNKLLVAKFAGSGHLSGTTQSP